MAIVSAPSGFWSSAYAYEADGQELVLRLGLIPEGFQDDRDAMAFAGPDLPVPAVNFVGDALGWAAAISDFTVASGTRMIPQSCSAIWISTSLLLDDSEPFTSTSSGRVEFWNGQLFGLDDGLTRQLCVPRSCGDLGRPDLLK